MSNENPGSRALLRRTFQGTCVDNPFSDVDRLSEVIDGAKRISRKKFLESAEVDEETLAQMKRFPHDYDFFQNGEIFFFTWSNIEHFFYEDAKKKGEHENLGSRWHTCKLGREQKEHLDDKYEGAVREQPILAELFDRLMSFGGCHVVLSGFEEDVDKILGRGELIDGRWAKMIHGEPSACHTNACRLWDVNKGRFVVMTGYALSSDGLWRQHSWGLDILGRKPRVVETTERRVLYYGFRMTPEEAEIFSEENL